MTNLIKQVQNVRKDFKMKYVIYDTETTGLTRSDEVVQFGAIVTDEKFVPQKAVSFYCYSQVPISEGARKVTGLDAKTVHELSGGATFEDRFLNLSFVNDKDVVWISYSANGFDERLVNQTLKNNGLSEHKFGEKKLYFTDSDKQYTLDAFNAIRLRVFNGKVQKLGQMAAALGYSEEKIDELFKRVIKGNGKFHDALYDSFVLWLVVNKCKERLNFGVR